MAFPGPLDGRSARFDKQFAVMVAAEIKSEKIKPLRKGDDPGLGLIESQPSRLQPLGQPRLDLLSLLPGMTAHDQESRRGGSHPPPPPEPDLNRSAPPAPTVHPSGIGPTPPSS